MNTPVDVRAAADRDPAPANPGAALRSGPIAHQGPGDLTLTSIVLFTLGAYGVAAGAATGQQAVVAVGVFAFTLFFIGIVWPVVVLSRVSVEAVAPTDATVGDNVDIHVRVIGNAARIEVRLLDPAGTWLRTAAPASGVIAHVAQRRGAFYALRVQVRSSAPLGVFVRTRTLRVALHAPTLVAPRATPSMPVLGPVADERNAATSTMTSRAGGETVRSVRPYVPGDPARLVHWPTSARRGELVVREHEPPPAVGVALLIDLRGPDPEAAAARAMGIGVATLVAGGLVWCGTCEADGPVGAPVANALELGRRLALAVDGAPPGAPIGWTPAEVRA